LYPAATTARDDNGNANDYNYDNDGNGNGGDNDDDNEVWDSGRRGLKTSQCLELMPGNFSVFSLFFLD